MPANDAAGRGVQAEHAWHVALVAVMAALTGLGERHDWVRAPSRKMPLDARRRGRIGRPKATTEQHRGLRIRRLGSRAAAVTKAEHLRTFGAHTGPNDLNGAVLAGGPSKGDPTAQGRRLAPVLSRPARTMRTARWRMLETPSLAAKGSPSTRYRRPRRVGSCARR